MNLLNLCAPDNELGAIYRNDMHLSADAYSEEKCDEKRKEERM